MPSGPSSCTWCNSDEPGPWLLAVRQSDRNGVMLSYPSPSSLLATHTCLHFLAPDC